MIAKGCPKCEQQVPVACKACPCGYSFFNARKHAAKVQIVSTEGDDPRRRTQRVRREKPDYYDSLEYEKARKKSKHRSSECDNDDDSRKDLAKPKRKKVKKEDDEDDDLIVNMSQEKQLQCSIILAELNRKMQIVTWKPT